MLTSAALAAGAIIAAIGLLLPSGSVMQYVAFTIAAAGGAVSWLAFPVWVLLIARALTGRTEWPVGFISESVKGHGSPHQGTGGKLMRTVYRVLAYLVAVEVAV
jgi:hypothetical protein